MPITPFHLGPALAAKAVAPKHLSFLVFGFAQVGIDIEVVPFFFGFPGEWPAHPFLHTYAGATVVAVFAVVVGRPVLERAIGLWNRLVARDLEGKFSIEPRIPLVPAVSGALVGGYSHVLLDSIMHSDVRPFFPWSDANPLLGLMSVLDLYLLCVVLGILGGIVLAATSILRRRAG